MRLKEVLDKFSNADFVLTVDGLCDELSFYEYQNEKKEKYWEIYENREIRSMAILTTNGQPELYIKLK